jgi:hypothetical protein
MRIQSAEPLVLLGLVSLLGACGGSTVKIADDSGLPDQDARPTGDGGVKHGDTGVPGNDAAPQPNDGGILNDAAPGACPATYAVGEERGVCGTSTAVCIYDEGTCVCGAPGPPHEGPNDWFCSPLTAGCPYLPAPENSACTHNGLSCDYGECSGGTARDCVGGVWTEGAIGCPL